MPLLSSGAAAVPQIWFGRATTEAGRDALGWYHEKQDKARGIGLGPAHDWSSHASDAFGRMCVAYEAPGAAVRVAARRREVWPGAGGMDGVGLFRQERDAWKASEDWLAPGNTV